MAKTYNQPACPVACSLDLIGDRWTLLIVRDLLRGRRRFASLQASLPGLPTNVLSERLKALEADGLIERRFYSDHPPRAEYFLTAKGIELGDVVRALYVWGSRHALAEPPPPLVHRACGHPVALHWACPHCGEGDVGRQVVRAEPQPAEDAAPV